MDEVGRPVSDEQVFLRASAVHCCALTKALSTVTDENGRFEFWTQITEGQIVAERGIKGFASIDFHRWGEVVLQFPAPVLVTGMVFDARGGPIEGGRITARVRRAGATLRELPEELITESDARGFFFAG